MDNVALLVDVEGRPLNDYDWGESEPPPTMCIPAMGKAHIESRNFYKKSYRSFGNTVVYLYTEWANNDKYMDEKANDLLALYANLREFFEAAGKDVKNLYGNPFNYKRRDDWAL